MRWWPARSGAPRPGAPAGPRAPKAGPGRPAARRPAWRPDTWHRRVVPACRGRRPGPVRSRAPTPQSGCRSRRGGPPRGGGGHHSGHPRRPWRLAAPVRWPTGAACGRGRRTRRRSDQPCHTLPPDRGTGKGLRRRNCTPGAPASPATAIGTAGVDLAHGSVGAHRALDAAKGPPGGEGGPFALTQQDRRGIPVSCGLRTSYNAWQQSVKQLILISAIILNDGATPLAGPDRHQ